MKTIFRTGGVAGYGLFKERQILQNNEQKRAFSTSIKEHLIQIFAQAMDTAAKYLVFKWSKSYISEVAIKRQICKSPAI